MTAPRSCHLATFLAVGYPTTGTVGQDSGRAAEAATMATMMMRGLVVCVVLALGCGGGEDEGGETDPPDDGQSDEMPQPALFGEACDVMADAICDRAVECGANFTYNACFQNEKGGCCLNDGLCGLPYGGNVDVWACAEALDGHSCAELDNYVLPAACSMSPG